MTWNPLHDSLLTSSVLASGPDVVAVWALLIASADSEGFSEITIPYVSSVLHMGDERAETAFGCLQAPDPKSRNQDQEGRRILRVDGGWQLVSHARYRERASRRLAAERASRYRSRQRSPQPQARGTADPTECQSCGQPAVLALGGRYLCQGCAQASGAGGDDPAPPEAA